MQINMQTRCKIENNERDAPCEEGAIAGEIDSEGGKDKAGP
jgi:hypothetical protein